MAFSEWKHSWFLEERNRIQREGKFCSLQHSALELRKKLVFNADIRKGRKSICSPLYNLSDWASQHPPIEFFLALPLHTCHCRPSVLSWAAFVDHWLSHKETAFTQSSAFNLSTVTSALSLIHPSLLDYDFSSGDMASYSSLCFILCVPPLPHNPHIHKFQAGRL